MEPEASSVAATESPSGPPGTRRLVIRIKLPSNTPSPPPVRRRLSRGALLLILGVIAVALSWVGIGIFRNHQTATSTETERAPDSKSQSPAAAAAPAPEEAAPVVSDALPPGIESRSTGAKPVEPERPEQADAPPSPINEVIPDVSQSAAATIRGTIRVSVRVIVDKHGAVLAATTDGGGPSRYFERLAIEAAKKWTFTAAKSQDQRVMLVGFNFTRAGTTARASSVQKPKVSAGQ